MLDLSHMIGAIYAFRPLSPGVPQSKTSDGKYDCYLVVSIKGCATLSDGAYFLVISGATGKMQSFYFSKERIEGKDRIC